jgi:hypothetical protein
MLDAIAQLATGFGLSTAAGLNAYLPLLILGLLARYTGLVTLDPPWDVLQSWWLLGLLVVLLAVEVIVDKVPAADTVNDVIQTLIRPIAGGVLFASSAGIVSDIHPVLALACGLLLAGGVHAVKATARPAITATSGGLANPVVSTAEDVVSAVLAVLAIALPILVALLAILTAGLLVFWLLRRWRRRRENQAPGWF